MRCIAVAARLRRRGCSVVFLAGESVRHVVEQYEFPFRPIPDVQVHASSHVRPARQLFDQENAPGFLSRQLAATVSALREQQADVVIYSNSNTAALAAGVLDRPTISLFAPAIVRIPSLDMARPMIGKWLRFLWLRHQTPLRKPVPSAFVGDRTFIPSIPPLIDWPLLVPPGLALRKNQLRVVGPLLPESPDCLPPRGVLLDELGVSGPPFVYATVGGAIFNLDLIRAVVQGIRDAGCNGLVAGGRSVTPEVSQALSSHGVQVTAYVPDDLRAIKAADVLVWHGGDQTMLEAVACGTPAIGLPYQLDQFPNVAGIVRFGAGLELSPSDLHPSALADAISRVRTIGSYHQRMAELREISRHYRGAVEVADAAEELVGTLTHRAPGMI